MEEISERTDKSDENEGADDSGLESSLTNEKKVTEYEKFENEIASILDRLRNLPSEASPLKIPRVPKDIRGIYSKLCEALNVPENPLMQHADDEIMDFSYHCLGPTGIIPVAKSLTTCQTVKTVDLKYNRLGAESLPAIILLIDNNEHVSHLNLQGNGIGKGSATMLGEFISRCYTVEFLDLSNNHLGDDELEEIGIALQKTDNIKELILNTNDFSSAKGSTFGSCVTKCTALLKLDLSRCHLEEGVKSLFGGLKNSNLTVLNLSRNGIPDEAATAIASGLRTSKSLQELDLSFNLISNKGAKTIAPGLKRSSTLEVMNLAHNPISGSTATKLLSSAGGNLKILDLTGIKVNLAFFKTLASYAKTGKEVKVLYGAEIRYASLPKDFFVPSEDSLSADNALTFIEKLADEKGVSLRGLLKNIHATFIAEQHAAMLAEAEAEGLKMDDSKPREDMKTEDFAKILSSSLIAIPRPLALELAELLSKEGSVNMWELIANIKWKPDDLNVKIKVPKPPEPDKSKDKGKGKKK